MWAETCNFTTTQQKAVRGLQEAQEMLNEVLAYKRKEMAGRGNKHGPGAGEKD